jgi:exosortase A
MTGSWGRALLTLGLVMGLWAATFSAEITAAIATWAGSAAYNHCYLVLPVAAWLGWTRRQRLVGLEPRPAPWAALLALGGGLAWLVAERLGIMEGRQFAALGVLLSLVLAVFGRAICRAMAAPLLYLVFLVPFGAFLVPALQSLTAWMIVAGLRLLEIPHFADGLTIEIPAGVFLVAEACAGLRFIVASLAFGALYALVMFRSPGRRLLVMLLAVAVPVLANGLRALGIVLLGHQLGSAEAAAADHLIYGWVFFSAVILLLTLAGLPFRQDGEAFSAAPWRPMPAPAALAPAALLTAAIGLAAPAAMMLVVDQGAPPDRVALRLVPPEGCIQAADDTLRCGDQTLTAEILAFPARTTWSAVVAQRQRLAGQDDEAMTYRAARNWQGRQSPAAGTVVVATWLGGARTGDGLRSRALQGWNSLLGGQGRPVVAVLALRPEPGAARADARGERQRRALLDGVAESRGAAIEQRSSALSNP